jgi:DNA-binding transcriptional LysR family regulator
MSVDLRLMRYVIAVAEAGSFHAAAQRLQMAESPLGRQIKALERELGVELFVRRPTQLTSPGRVFVESARRVLREAERTVARTQLAAAGQTEAVRVGYTPSMAYHLVPKLLARLRIRHPDLGIEVHELGGAALDAALHDGRVDVGIGHGLAHPPGFSVTMLCREALGVVVGARHRLAGRERAALGDLRGEPLSLARREVAPRWYDRVLGAVLRSGETFDVVDEHGPGLDLVGVGEREGFTVLPVSAVEWLPEGFTWVTVSDELGTVDVEAVGPAAPSDPVKVVVDAASEIACGGRTGHRNI